MERKKLIDKIEELRGSKVVTYVTADQAGPMNGRIAPDSVPFFAKQLQAIAPAGKVERIDLFIYSGGGDTMVPWRLVSMIRERCNSFGVLVPYKAHSAATMISLGADELIMGDLSEISPIDPSTANVFNPQDPLNPQGRIPISVEDVIAYFDLAKTKFGIKSDEDLTKIFNKFVEATPQVHPLALGNVNRIHNLIRLVARRLLKSHNKPMKEDEIEKVVEYFTEKLFSHQYVIGRKEAREELGLKSVVYADTALSDAMNSLYEDYKAEMNLGAGPWNAELELGANTTQTKKGYKVAYIESTKHSNNFSITVDLKRQQVMMPQHTPQGVMQVPQEQVGVRLVEQGWY